MLATYIHDLDPVLWDISEAIKLRWYGLSYLVGFIAAYWLLVWQGKRGLWPLKKDQTSDFITLLAIAGVFLGGRLGHMLFYHTRENGASWMTEDPLMLFRVWDGGMASHGGILGIVIVSLIYAWRKKVSWLALGDGIVTVAPIGLFCGRMANFINGEIYGRVAHGVSWAVKFPATLRDGATPEEAAFFDDAMLAATQADESLSPLYLAWKEASASRAAGDSSVDVWATQNALYDGVIARSRENADVLNAIGGFLEPRHPAQVYEAIVEGALLFVVLFGLRLAFPKMRVGILTALFFILYAIGRISVEAYKLPEVENVGSLQMGSFLSLFMIAGGLAFLAYSLVWGGKSDDNSATTE